MVLSLVDICLRSIVNLVENGTISDAHSFVPPQLRQSLLNMVLARGKINNPIWKRELSIREFLRGMSSFSTRRGEENDSEYLNRVAESMGSIAENGVTKLELNLYLTKNTEGNIVEMNLGGIVRTIGQCTNLKSLNIKMKLHDETCFDIYDVIDAEIGLLNQMQTTALCRDILENLIELSMTGFRRMRLISDYPIIAFKKLTSLRLAVFTVDDGRWRELLNSVGATLTNLQLDRVRVATSDNYLPIPLPVLEELKIEGGHYRFSDFRCTSSFVANLQRCSKLKKVRLSLEWYDDFSQFFGEDEENLKALRRIKPELEVKLQIGNCEILDGKSNSKLVSIFNDKITDLYLNFRSWDPRLTNAFENVVDVCRNLTTFTFWSLYIEAQHEDEKEKVHSALVRFFADQKRASKLRKLRLRHKIDFGVLMIILENCTNLDFLEIGCNSQLVDSHLIRFADRGAKLSTFWLNACDNITDEGVIPILASSGKKLVEFTNIEQSSAKITDRTWRVLFDHCPNIETVYGMPEHLKELARSKCFNLRTLNIYALT